MRQKLLRQHPTILDIYVIHPASRLKQYEYTQKLNFLLTLGLWEKITSAFVLNFDEEFTNYHSKITQSVNNYCISQVYFLFFQPVIASFLLDISTTPIGDAFLIKVITGRWLDKRLSLHLREWSTWLCAELSLSIRGIRA